MNFRLTLTALIACGTLLSSSPLFAQGSFGAVTPWATRPYHACLYARYINDFCQFHYWDSFSDCVIANGACGCPTGGYWGPDIVDACHALRRGHHHL